MYSPSNPQYFAVYQKHIDQVINKEFVENRGYFWFVSEIKLYENSAVLFGANELTPTLEIQKALEPSKDTQRNESSNHSEEKEDAQKEFYLNLFK